MIVVKAHIVEDYLSNRGAFDDTVNQNFEITPVIHSHEYKTNGFKF